MSNRSPSRTSRLLPLALATMAFAGTAGAQAPGELDIAIVNDCTNECGFPEFDST